MVTIEIIGGPSFQVKWDAQKMHNAQGSVQISAWDTSNKVKYLKSVN